MSTSAGCLRKTGDGTVTPFEAGERANPKADTVKIIDRHLKRDKEKGQSTRALRDTRPHILQVREGLDEARHERWTKGGSNPQLWEAGLQHTHQPRVLRVPRRGLQVVR